MIIDMKVGDVNGDLVPDKVYLVGNKAENSFYKDFMIVIDDGKTGYRYTIPLSPAYNYSAAPWIFLGDFTGDRAEDIFISLPLAGARAVYYLITFVNNRAAFLIAPDQFPTDYDSLSKMLGFDVVYKDFYKVDITSKILNQTITLDVSNRKEVYEGVIYNEDGTLIKPFNGFVLYSPYLYPIKIDRDMPYKLMAMDDIAGMSHADQLGSLVYYLRYSSSQKTWILDPEMAQVLIE